MVSHLRGVKIWDPELHRKLSTFKTSIGSLSSRFRERNHGHQVPHLQDLLQPGALQKHIPSEGAYDQVRAEQQTLRTKPSSAPFAPPKSGCPQATTRRSAPHTAAKAPSEAWRRTTSRSSVSTWRCGTQQGERRRPAGTAFECGPRSFTGPSADPDDERVRERSRDRAWLATADPQVRPGGMQSKSVISNPYGHGAKKLLLGHAERFKNVYQQHHLKLLQCRGPSDAGACSHKTPPGGWWPL